MNEAVAAEMKRLSELMDLIESKPISEQLALIRAHIAATAEAATCDQL